VRGNHYHNDTFQVIYLLAGRLRLVTQMPGQSVLTRIVEAGDLIRTPPVERHAVQALEDSTMLVLTRGPRAGRDYESDTLRLVEPLIDR
jgi:quercetin dioxygenase-like cupin family protein